MFFTPGSQLLNVCLDTLRFTTFSLSQWCWGNVYSHVHSLTVSRVCVCVRARLEAAKDDYRIRCEELEKELLEVKGQNEELTSLADEAQSLKDEMDVLR